MHIDLPTDTFEKVVRYLQIELYIQLVIILVTTPIIRNICIYFISVILRLNVERLALAIFYDWPSLAKVLGKDQLGYY